MSTSVTRSFIHSLTHSLRHCTARERSARATHDGVTHMCVASLSDLLVSAGRGLWDTWPQCPTSLPWPSLTAASRTTWRLDATADEGMLELFSSRISVDQDLSVIVAEIINDDDVKQRLVPIVFHASVTQQRRSGSKTRISCSHVHERTNSCPPLQTRVEKKGATQTDA